MIVAGNRLRVVAATPLSDADGERITRLESRIDLVLEHELLPPMRHPADFSGDPSFARTPAQQARFDQLVDSADALYGIPDVDPRALSRTVQANLALRWVHTMAAGGGAQVRAASLSAEQLERVVFTTSAGVHGGPLAEFAVFGVLAGAKTLPRLLAQQRAHAWTGRWTMGQISEQTILLLGLGGIGGEVAVRLSSLGATVIGVSRSGRPVSGVTRVVHPDRMVDEIAGADAIVTTLPGTEATECLIGEDFLSRVKHGVTIVNVGRGTVIDEEALIAALVDGRVGFAALDVFAVEPLAADSLLWELENVLVSPHTAALNAAEDRRIAELFAENATRLLDGRELRNRVDTVEFY
ncbi:D-2-hydroxyacid dehydrogenase [Luethyella okanaganae]|uniref:D-2-hydroxyacid dehydrogenase n=1 Tax=Luethyella okanaganae TaxID=69372 RepID=A0ABW1VC74_9MICO